MNGRKFAMTTNRFRHSIKVLTRSFNNGNKLDVVRTGLSFASYDMLYFNREGIKNRISVVYFSENLRSYRCKTAANSDV